MSVAEIVVSAILGILTAAVYTFAVYRKGYEAGFKRATELAEEQRQFLYKYSQAYTQARKQEEQA